MLNWRRSAVVSLICLLLVDMTDASQRLSESRLIASAVNHHDRLELMKIQRLGNNDSKYLPRAASRTNNQSASIMTQSLHIRGGSTTPATVTVTPRGTVRHATPSQKLANLTERTLPAVALLLGLAGIVKFFGKSGLSALVLVLSPGMYHEMVSVVLQPPNDLTPTVLANAATTTMESNLIGNVSAVASDPLQMEGSGPPLPAPKVLPKPLPTQRISNQWWWFLAMSLPTTFSGYLESLVNRTSLRLGSYCMMMVGWMAWIVCLNSHHQSSPAVFCDALREIAVYHLAGVFTIFPVYCWMATLSDFATGQSWILYGAMLVILNDTLAYLFGVTLGKHALLPIISPKKTSEGWIGAFVTTLLLSVLVWKVFFPIKYGQDSFIVALFCSGVAPLGGFLASAIKRAYGKKDFSNLIAGHGGLVDRLDCQLITAPFVYLLLNAMEPSEDVFARHHAAMLTL
ncbi:hypothetical protein MPSEU_000467600 [Mayamaea pseudoterrestris]|nr:hypothetical protein MPSEU_000467600 [Mayamaea pseudoterrestris]